MSASLNRRARQAEQTRADILRAARGLFADRGYAHTSVRDVARAAGVSAQTVYDSVGPKRALVERLNDLIDREAGIPEIARAAAEERDPEVLAATGARITRAILESSGDIVRALIGGASAEPELADVLAEGRARHVAGARQIVALLRDLQALPLAADAERCAEDMAAVTDVQFAFLLRESYGWPLDHIEQLMATASRAAVLPQKGGDPLRNS